MELRPIRLQDTFRIHIMLANEKSPTRDGMPSGFLHLVHSDPPTCQWRLVKCGRVADPFASNTDNLDHISAGETLVRRNRASMLPPTARDDRLPLLPEATQKGPLFTYLSTQNVLPSDTSRLPELTNRQGALLLSIFQAFFPPPTSSEQESILHEIEQKYTISNPGIRKRLWLQVAEEFFAQFTSLSYAVILFRFPAPVMDFFWPGPLAPGLDQLVNAIDLLEFWLHGNGTSTPFTASTTTPSSELENLVYSSPVGGCGLGAGSGLQEDFFPGGLAGFGGGLGSQRVAVLHCTGPKGLLAVYLAAYIYQMRARLGPTFGRRSGSPQALGLCWDDNRFRRYGNRLVLEHIALKRFYDDTLACEISPSQRR
ncbi:unnamed protein product [Protopolystoma xenopodis]|uniref:Uncharacterized protein n=1 Tax=Protopolystoma xenopodis TaxID=117903 RepID=A0A3S4ZV09_9PLAT|nr:unnamed protein product [Protopolystoma xenopodis]